MKLAALTIYWITLFVATHLPPRHVMRTGWNDKIQHFLAYAILAGLLSLVVDVRDVRRAVLVVVAICLLYGAFDEWTQIFVGRDCELLDWLADAAGAIVGAIIALALRVAASRVQR